MTRSIRALSAVHLGGNALLLWLGYYWLGTSESRAVSLLWSAFVAVVLVALACWLHGATFASFAAPAGLGEAFRSALRNLFPILVAVAVILGLYILVGLWANYSTQPAYTIASWLTLKLRKPIKPNSVYRIFRTITWLVRWVVLPVLVLPWVAGISAHGWSGFRRRLPRPRLYWIEVPLLLLCALWLPFQVLDWVPHMSNFSLEMVSFIVRLLVAYLLFVGAWLLLAFFTSGGKPVLSQPSTVAKP